MKYIFSFLFCLLLGWETQAQFIWPGDANNNGKVNAVDVLFVGLGYNAKGPKRTNASTKWEAQPLSPWASSFPNGLNYAYADGNGDGEINKQDIQDDIEPNFGLTHGIPQPDAFLSGQLGKAPRLFFTTANAVIEPGEELEIDLNLGDEDFPLEKFYGIAFLLSYNRDLVRDLDVEDEANPWFDIKRENSQHFIYVAPTGGQIEAAFTLTNQETIQGFGRIARVKLVIEDIIVGRPIDTLRFTIDSVLLMDENMKPYPVVKDTLEVFVTNNPLLVTSDTQIQIDPELVKVMPNPNKGSFGVQTFVPIEQWEMFDLLGRKLPINVQKNQQNSWQIDSGRHPAGIYFLKGKTRTSFCLKKIILLQP